MCLIPGDVQQNDAMAFAYGDTMTAEKATEADWEGAKAEEAHEKEDADEKSEEKVNVLYVGNYIFSDILEERVLKLLIAR